MHTGSQQQVFQLRLDGELNIYRAAELKPVVLSPIAAGVRVEADLSGVTEIDTAGLQLLMLGKKTAQAAGGDFCLLNHSNSVIEAFELLSLASYFGDPVVIPQRGTAANGNTR